ncbi:MAG: DUF2510 domain-containing protein [Actinomycetota bacterium]
MTGLPPAGWYDDPEYPDHLRYWAGTAWSEHRSPKQPTPAATASALSDLGTWLGQTFELPVRRWRPVLALMAAGIVVIWLMTVVLVEVWDDLRYFDGTWTGFSWGKVAASILVGVAAAVVSIVIYLAQIRIIHDARLGLHPSLGEAITAGLRALPRTIGWGLLLLAASVGIVLVVALVAAVSAPVAVLAVVAIVVLAIWAWVKLSFLGAAFVVPVPGLNPVKASADVSRDRFWSVFGRLLVLTLVVIGISLALGLLSAPLDATVDVDAFDEHIVTVERADGTEELLLLDLGGVFDAAGVTGVWSLLSAIPTAITSLVTMSGIAILYAETYQRRPEPPTPL